MTVHFQRPAAQQQHGSLRMTRHLLKSFFFADTEPESVPELRRLGSLLPAYT